MDIRRDNRYDIWRCAKCSAERRQASLPHRQPKCCGTGMWWQRFELGREYDYDHDVAMRETRAER